MPKVVALFFTFKT